MDRNDVMLQSYKKHAKGTKKTIRKTGRWNWFLTIACFSNLIFFNKIKSRPKVSSTSEEQPEQ